MVDPEVADILAEIKRKVTSAEKSTAVEAASVPENAVRSVSQSPRAGANGYASLPVMARTWDRLPPLLSNRTGAIARLELWLKGKLKRASKWFTWEQVNFNAAAYQTFLEVVETLKAYEQQLSAYEQQLSANEQRLSETKQQLELQGEELKQQLDQISSLAHQIATQLEQTDRRHLAMIAQLNARLEGIAQIAKDSQDEMNARLERIAEIAKGSQDETNARLGELVTEFRAQDERLLDEQRVCYRQLSLELSESRVLQDRARRELETRISELENEPQINAEKR